MFEMFGGNLPKGSGDGCEEWRGADKSAIIRINLRKAHQMLEGRVW